MNDAVQAWRELEPMMITRAAVERGDALCAEVERLERERDAARREAEITRNTLCRVCGNPASELPFEWEREPAEGAGPQPQPEKEVSAPDSRQYRQAGLPVASPSAAAPTRCCRCGKWYVPNPGRAGLSCCVLHGPGQCCHYTETEVTAPDALTCEAQERGEYDCVSRREFAAMTDLTLALAQRALDDGRWDSATERADNPRLRALREKVEASR